MGSKPSKNEAPPQQQQRATETPTGVESQDSHTARDIPFKSDEKTVPEKPPHNYEAILKDADEDFNIDNSSMQSLYNQLYDGVFLNRKQQKYWVDKETGSNCFMLYARQFSITWGGTPEYWTWFSHPETRDVSVEVAKLIKVCWLEIHAKFDTAKLTPGTLYQVAFVIKMDDSPTGWTRRVTLNLHRPDGTAQVEDENLMRKPKEQWIEIPVGEFQVLPEHTRALEASMLEIDGGKWKTGLSVKGVIIQPKMINVPE